MVGQRPIQIHPVSRVSTFSAKFVPGRMNIALGRRLSAANDLEAEKDRLLRTAAQKMISSASAMVASLNNVYNQYGNFVRNSWIRTAVSNAIIPVAGPQIDAWFRADQAGRAVATIQAGNRLANEWMNMIKSEYLMVFDEAVLEMDPALADQTNTAFEWVSEAYRRNTDLMKDINNLPQVVVGRAEDAFFGGLKTSFPETTKTLGDIAVALGGLAKSGLKATKGLTVLLDKLGKGAEAASEGASKVPWLVLTGAGILLVWYLVKS